MAKKDEAILKFKVAEVLTLDVGRVMPKRRGNHCSLPFSSQQDIEEV